MAIALVMPQRATTALVRQLNKLAPDIDIDCWPNLSAGTQYPLALAWQPEPHALASVPGIQGVHSLGAGVDALLADKTLPSNLPIARIVDPDLSEQMAEYAVLHVLAHKRRYLEFDRFQATGEWSPALPRPLDRVGVLGLGVIGRHLAKRLQVNGFQVHGWARHPRQIDGVHCHHNDAGLNAMLSQVQAVICVLPLTNETQGLLNAERLTCMQDGALLINIARGGLLDEAALLAVLDNGPVAHAVLDVFATEPLPGNHPFWAHEQITVTPHVAGLTNPKTASQQIIDNYRRLCAGQAMHNTVDRQRGY
jgi:glyoxylate/hydroxypyruvate reductase A